MLIRMEITSQKNILSLANWVQKGYKLAYEADGRVFAERVE